MRILLTCRSGGLTGRSFRLNQPVNRIGRAAEMTLRLDPLRDLRASSKHCEIELADGTALLRDVGSSNGTWLNGERLVAPLKLNSGDIFQMGPDGPEFVVEHIDDGNGSGENPSTRFDNLELPSDPGHSFPARPAVLSSRSRPPLPAPESSQARTSSLSRTRGAASSAAALEGYPKDADAEFDALLLTNKVAALQSRIQDARNAVREKERGARVFVWLFRTAVVALVIGLIAGFAIVSAQRDTAVKAEATAAASEKAALLAKNAESKAKDEAIASKNEAVAAQNEAIASNNRAVAEKKDAVTAGIEALAATKELQKTAYKLFREKYKQASEQRRHDDAALYLSRAIELAHDANLSVEMDRLALRSETPLMTRMTWFRCGGLELEQLMQSGPGEPIWGQDTSGHVFKAMVDGMGGWRLERLACLPARVNAQMALATNAGLLRATENELSLLRPDGSVEVTLYQFANNTLNHAVFVTPGGSVAYFVEGADLVAFDLANRDVVKRWTLPYAAVDLSVWKVVISQDGRTAVLNATLKDVRKLIVFDLTQLKVVLERDRQTGVNNSFVSDGKRVALGGNETPSEMLWIDLAKPAEVHAWKTPWPAAAIVSINDDRIVVAHEDGSLRDWSLDGRVLRTRMIDNSGIIGAFDLPSGKWLIKSDGVAVRPDWENPVVAEFRQPEGVIALGLAYNAAKPSFVAVTASQLEIRDAWDGSLERVFPLTVSDADYNATPGQERLYAKLGDELIEVDPTTLQIKTRIDSAGKLPFQYLPERHSLVAWQKDAVYCFDVPGLAKREVLFPKEPFALRPSPAGLWIVYKNLELGRIEIWEYVWSDAEAKGPLIIAVDPATVNAVAFDENSRRVAWAVQDGSAYACAVPAFVTSEKLKLSAGDRVTICPPNRERVRFIEFIEPDIVAISRDDGVLERFTWIGSEKTAHSLDRLTFSERGALTSICKIGPAQIVASFANKSFGRIEWRTRGGVTQLTIPAWMGGRWWSGGFMPKLDDRVLSRSELEELTGKTVRENEVVERPFVINVKSLERK